MVSTRVTPNANQLPVEVCGSSSYGRYPKISNARTYNMFLTSANNDQEVWLVSFAGYQKILDVAPSAQGRALFNSTRGGFAIAVVGDMVYRIDSSFNLMTIGTIGTTTGEVFVAENLNRQIVLTDGANAYIYYYGTPTGPLTLLTLDPRLTPNYVEYHNTYFLFGNAQTGPNGSLWFVYGVDGASNTTLDLVTSLAIQTKADYALAVKRLPGRGNNIIVMGTIVSEIWTQIPGLQIYQRNESINIDYGCVSVATIGEGNNYIAWLAANEGEQPVIMVYDGNSAERISTDGIDYLLSTMKYPSQSTAILYRLDGHLFYQLTFFNPVDNLTLLYDFNTKLFFNLSDQALNYHPARQIIYFGLSQYFCSLNNGSIYQIDSDITYINENLISNTTPDNDLIYDIQRIRITPSVRDISSSRFIANSLVLTLEQGMDPNYQGPVASYIITEDIFNPPDDNVTTESGIYLITEDSQEMTNNPTQVYYQPRIDLAISKDGAVTWSNYAARGLHPIGHRKNILHWEAMGVANDIAFKFRFWSKYRIVVNQALLDVII